MTPAKRQTESAEPTAEASDLAIGRLATHGDILRLVTTANQETLPDLVAMLLACLRNELELASAFRRMLRLLGAPEPALSLPAILRAVQRLERLKRFMQLRGATSWGRRGRLLERLDSRPRRTAPGVGESMTSLRRWSNAWNTRGADGLAAGPLAILDPRGRPSKARRTRRGRRATTRSKAG